MSHLRPVGFIGNPSDYWVSSVLSAFALGTGRTVAAVLFAERQTGAISQEAPVAGGVRSIPCWSSALPRYEDLFQAVSTADVGQLHILISLSTFAAIPFGEFLQKVKNQGIEIVVHLEEDDLQDRSSFALMKAADRIIVESSAMRYQAACSGLALEKIVIAALPGAKPALSASEARKNLLLSAAVTVVTTFMSRSCGEELRDIFTSCAQLRSTGNPIQLVVLRADRGVVAGMKDYGLDPILPWESTPEWITVVRERFPGNIDRYLSASDIVVFPSLRPSRELTYALSAAAECGAALITPDHEPFSSLAPDGVILRRAQTLQLSTAIHAVLEHRVLAKELKANAVRWAEARTSELYAELITSQGSGREAARGPATGQIAPPSVTKPVVNETIANPSFSITQTANAPAERPSAGAQPRILVVALDSSQGGDALVSARAVTAAIRSAGLDVTFKEGIPDSFKGYDLVHFISDGGNGDLETGCRACTAAAVPFIISPMYGGWVTRSATIAGSCGALERYIAKGQPKARWAEVAKGNPSARVKLAELSWVLEHCSAIAPFGAQESALLGRDLPQQTGSTARDAILLGYEHAAGDGGAAFTAAHKVRDFILCVGGFGWMGNQLSLLRALEESDLPLVMLGRGAGTDPAYLEACKWFVRKGETVVMDALPAALAASAIAAARIVVSPSWFAAPQTELFAAAKLGKNIVLSDSGNGRDYFGDEAYYAPPEDPDALHTAILAAYYAPVRPGLAARAESATVPRSAEKLLAVYRAALKLRADLRWPELAPAASAPSRPLVAAAPIKLELEKPPGLSDDELVSESLETATLNARDASHSVERIPGIVGSEPPAAPIFSIPSLQLTPELVIDGRLKEMCDRGDTLVREGAVDEARKLYEEAAAAFPKHSRPHRSLGVLALQIKRYDDAERCFSAATERDPSDVKALVGLGAVCWAREDVEGAFKRYVEAAEIDPQDKTPIFYLVQAGYASNRLGELEHALRKSLQADADNQYIQYCLAGCYYRQNRKVLAKSVVERILRNHPQDEAARELMDKLRQDEAEAMQHAAPGSSRSEPVAFAVNADQQARARAAFDEMQARIENAKRARQHDAVITLCSRMEELPGITEADKAYITVVRGEIYACRNEIEAAEKQFQVVKDNDTWAFRAVCGLGAIEAARGNWSSAEKLFELSLELKPEYDVALAGLGVCAVERGKHELAWSLFRHALSRNPGNLRAMYGALQVGYALGFIDEMSVCLEAYLDEHPGDLGMLYSYAGCLYAQGRNADAEHELNKILLLDPTHMLARELSEKISATNRRAAGAA